MGGAMAGYITADGVSIWYDDRGAGDPVVLLHGGLTDSRDFTGNLDAWRASSGCCCPNAVGMATRRTCQARSRWR